MAIKKLTEEEFRTYGREHATTTLNLATTFIIQPKPDGKGIEWAIKLSDLINHVK